MEGFLGLIVGPRVAKRYKRHVSRAQKAHERDMHEDVVYLLRDCALKAPMLEPTREALIMERVDTSRPLWEEEVSDEQIEVLAEGLMALQKAGYEMRDVEVYVQPDGSLRMLDFGQVTKRPQQAEARLLSAAIVPASEVERLEAAWAAKHLPKVKSLHELYQLKHSDYVLRKCTRKEWSDRETLNYITERHFRWHQHMYHSGSHKMPDGTHAYLYSPTSCPIEDAKPVYKTQAWKDWVTTYRAEFWKGQFYGSDYQPLCAKDCELRLPHCDCGELFHGMKLMGGKLVRIDEPVTTEVAVVNTDSDEETEVEQLLRLRRP